MTTLTKGLMRACLAAGGFIFAGIGIFGLFDDDYLYVVEALVFLLPGSVALSSAVLGMDRRQTVVLSIVASLWLAATAVGVVAYVLSLGS